MSNRINPYFVVVRMTDNPLSGATAGDIKIWKDYDDGYAWGSAAYEILGYADSYAEAKEIRRVGVVVP